MEKKEKKQKKSKMPEGYIGRPKPMKTKKFEFHKPTVGTYIRLGIYLVVIAFIAYIGYRLVQVSKVVDPEFEYYEMKDSKLSQNFVLESNDLIFTLDPVTTQFTVQNKKTGKIWNSNPVDVNSDKVALPKEKNNMMSTFLLTYSNVNGNDDIYDTYTKSIKNNFYDVEKKGNEILVHYTIGDIEREYIFPLAIYEDELNKWEETLTKSQIRTIGNAFHKYSVDSFKTDAEREEMLQKYPKMDDQPIYLIFENLKPFMKEQVEKMFKDVGYTMEDYNRSKELYKENTIQDVPAFNLTVSYKLEGDNLVVEVPFDEISYKHTYPIVKLSVLPYFGAGSLTDEGFVFVPEGGGNIINFNNGKTNQNGYYADVYGWDYATDRKSVNTETRITFPVFGVSNNGESYICIMEDGACYAGITAEISGKLGSYNYVRADYTMLHREQFDISSRNINAQFSYEASLPAGEKIRQVYKFQDKGDYVDMAIAYRDHLFKGAKKTNNKNVPLAIDIIGSVDKVQQVAGMPKTLPYALTSYEQAETIIKGLDEAGIKDANIRLAGFINEGVHQTYLNKIKFISELGGKGKFKSLIKNTKDLPLNIYLDASVQTAYRSTMFGNGFNKYTKSARFASDELCKISQYSPIWYGKLDTLDEYYLVNPAEINKSTKKLISSAEKYGINVSFADNGYLLSSDFNDDDLVSRTNAMNQQVANFKDIKDKNLGLMVRGGNDYSVKYADFITDVNLKGNSYAIFDKSVPFYQIALHGYKNYSGSSLNISGELENMILEAAETASGLLFTLTGESTRILQETNFSEYYATYYDDWKDTLVELYNKYNSDMSKVTNSCITDFEYITDDVVKTTFENGYAVYVNYGYGDYTTQSGKKVASRDYSVMKVEE